MIRGYSYGLVCALALVSQLTVCGCRRSTLGYLTGSRNDGAEVLPVDDQGTPYVAVKRPDGSVSGCTGLSVRPNWVLTTRRCIAAADGTPVGPENISVNLFKVRKGLTAVRVLPHPKLDVALLQLPAALVDANGRSFANRLYESTVSKFVDETFHTQGYSQTGDVACQAKPAAAKENLLRKSALTISKITSPSEFLVVPTGHPQMGVSGNLGSALWHSVDGTRRPIGILSECTCANSKKRVKACKFVRADAIRGWVEGVTGGAIAHGTVVGGSRSDGSSAIVYRDASNHLRELCLGGPCGKTWRRRELGQGAVATSLLSNHVRSDGTNAIIYRNEKDHIVELRMEGPSGRAADLMDLSGAPSAIGNPSAYVRADSLSVIVYASADRHIHELALMPKPPTWHDTNLTGAAKAPLAESDPIGYVRADGMNAVVFRSEPDSHIQEISLSANGTWVTTDLTTNATAPAASGTPYPYSRADGTSAVLYINAESHIQELSLSPGAAAWKVTDLTQAAHAPLAANEPTAYVHADGAAAVVYVAKDHHVYELAQNLGSAEWKLTCLTTSSSSPPSLGFASGYVRADRVSAVVYQSADSRIRELTLRAKGWHMSDLSMLAGGV